MDFFNVIIRSILSLIVLFFMTKLLGKKQVSQLSLFDYVVGISIGNFASEMSINLEQSVFNAMTATIVFGVCAYLISVLTLKSLKLRKFVIGVPTILIQHGKIMYENLKQTKFDINDLLEEARGNGYFDLNEVEFALLEANGHVSFLPKGEHKNVTIKDMDLKVKKQGLCANVIIDGNIMVDNLEAVNKDENWLLHELEVNGKNIKNVILATVDINNKLTIYDRYHNEEVLKILE